MSPPVKLPWELEEDIVSRLPPQSLAKFRSVCKRWNALLDEKSFINNHFARARPQFIFLTNSNIYSIDMIGLDGVDPTIRLLALDASGIPYQELNFKCTTITTCDEFLFLCSSYWVCPKGSALWNPWLRQVKWIEYADTRFKMCGLGYDNTRPEKVYKMLGFIICLAIQGNFHEQAAIYECESHAFKFIDTPNEDWPVNRASLSVSLNGNLYWITPIPNTDDFFIRSFDFSKEIFEHFSLLPCRKNQSWKELVLGVFKGDKLSLLKQCSVTKKVDIWVTKKEIDKNNNGSNQVVWINLLTFPTTNLPSFLNMVYGISYFIYDNTTLIMCCGDDETGEACIYIVRRDLFKKIQIDSGFFKCCHCVYAPNFIPVPLELKLQV